jgi:tetratricopeptide (TPR) repeat protein
MRLSRILRSLGTNLRALHRYADAEAVFRRALAVAERAVGPDHSQTAIAHAQLGDILAARHEYAAALQQYQRAEPIFAATLGTDHINYAFMMITTCALHLDLKQSRKALLACTRGLGVLERAVGANAPDVADALVGVVARAYAANAMIPESLAAMERGIAIWPKGNPTASAKIAEGEFTLAQTMWEYAPSHRSRARTLASRARDRLRDAGPEHAARRDEIAAWLATHR